MAAEDPSKSNGGGGPSKPGEDENKQNPEAPRPKGAPNRFSCLLIIGQNKAAVPNILVSNMDIVHINAILQPA